ncbi:fam-g protein [Plasmodium gallinaceum]|uniref:Fam-g protein n=1 Tax=Plasmodium gallinaceum TaxID=5849 RepID=A0A1J1GWS0_PLAGA|nr:fam-g protein [Plasmodium gallinaceum]CRG96919.1 fam-g protein [Plasmodium gallinaceum]
MKTLTLCLKITTFLLLILLYQCFYKCDSYKTLIDKNILQTKNKLKYERVLTEGNIEGKKQTYAEGCLEESPLDNKKNKCKNQDKYKDPSNYWNKVIIPQMWKRFDQETSGMDPKLKEKKWNVELHKFSNTKVRDMHLISRRCDFSDEEKKQKIDSIMRELHSEFEKFLCKYKKGMTDNKAESESKKGMTDNKTESESKKGMTDNKTESESKKELRDNKTECESNKEMRDKKTESESKKEMTDNKTECESNKEMKDNKTESESKRDQGKNKKKNEKSNIFKFLFCRFDNH